MKEVKICLIGVVNMSAYHLIAIDSEPRLELVGICDIDEQKVAKEASARGLSTCTNYKKMLDETRPDAVLICLPHKVYPEVLSEVTSRKIHILKDKPLATSLREGISLVTQAEEAGVLLMIGTQRRHQLSMSHIFNRIGDIGKIFMVRARFIYNFSLVNLGWRAWRKLSGGGVYLDAVYHMVDLLQWYLGVTDEIAVYMSTGARPNVSYDTDDSGVTIFRYKEGPVGNMSHTFCSSPKAFGITFHGTEGSLEADDSDVVLRTPKGEVGKSESFDDDWILPLKAQIKHFTDCILNNEECISPAHGQLQNMAFIDEAYRSFEQGVFGKPAEYLEKTLGVK